MGKLPYIQDRQLYAAVMGACRYVRETGYFNRAVNYYADKYGVSANDVAKYVRIAQGAGQKQMNTQRPARHYLWFAVEYYDKCYYNPDLFVEPNDSLPQYRYAVKKGISEETVKRRMDLDYRSDMFRTFERVKACDNEAQAIILIDTWRNERRSDGK